MTICFPTKLSKSADRNKIFIYDLQARLITINGRIIKDFWKTTMKYYQPYSSIGIIGAIRTDTTYNICCCLNSNFKYTPTIKIFMWDSGKSVWVF